MNDDCSDCNCGNVQVKVKVDGSWTCVMVACTLLSRIARGGIGKICVLWGRHIRR